jgi:hypothetical protein
MNKKMPAALAIAMWALIPAWTPRGWAQAGSSLPPQLQTDAQREAARAARVAAASVESGESGESGGPARRSNAPGGDAAAAFGAAMLADVLDATAVPAHDAAMRPPRRPDPVADRRGGVDPEADAWPDDPPGRGRQ